MVVFSCFADKILLHCLKLVIPIIHKTPYTSCTFYTEPRNCGNRCLNPPRVSASAAGRRMSSHVRNQAGVLHALYTYTHSRPGRPGAQIWVGLVSFRKGQRSKWRLMYSSVVLLSALSSEKLSPAKVREPVHLQGRNHKQVSYEEPL